MRELDLLILGAGWTSTFLIPLLSERNISFAATTRDGRQVAGADTIKWSFNPAEESTNEKSQFASLPRAKHVLITFPLAGKGQAATIVHGYEKAHTKARFIQFGSTGIWQIPQKSVWTTRHSPYDKANSRALAEDELRSLGGCVLNLGGLWGGARDPRTWVPRVAKSKDDVRGKKSLHMVHGMDVARAVVAVTGKWEHAKGQRWMLTDGFVYDWWCLFLGWADFGEEKDKVDREPSDTARWTYECMKEEDVPALPRSMDTLGRCYNSREFWETFDLTPLKARI